MKMKRFTLFSKYYQVWIWWLALAGGFAAFFLVPSFETKLNDRYIPFPLNSLLHADYSADPAPTRIPPIHPNILKDIHQSSNSASISDLPFLTLETDIGTGTTSHTALLVQTETAPAPGQHDMATATQIATSTPSLDLPIGTPTRDSSTRTPTRFTQTPPPIAPTPTEPLVLLELPTRPAPLPTRTSTELPSLIPTLPIPTVTLHPLPPATVVVPTVTLSPLPTVALPAPTATVPLIPTDTPIVPTVTLPLLPTATLPLPIATP